MIAPATLTLRRAFDLLLSDAPLADSTRRLRRYQFAAWERLTDDPPIGFITTATFDAVRSARLKAGESPETAETLVNTAIRVLRAAREAGLIDEIPKRGRRLRGQPGKTPKISLEEFDRFLQAIPKVRLAVARLKSLSRGRIEATRCADFARAFWGTCFFSALRRANVLALDWKNFGSDTLDVRQFKTGNVVSIPIHPVWRRLLSALPGAWTEGPLFRISQKTLYRDQRAIAALSGTSRVTPQSVRALAARCYERAHAGAGRLVLGRPFPGADGNYLDAPEILRWASEALIVPPALLTPAERNGAKTAERQLLAGFRRLPQADRDSVLRLVSRAGG